MLELVGDFGGERGAKIGLDDFQHQVDGRRAAGAGVALAVDLENIAGAFNVREFLAEGGAVFPMDRAAVAVHQPGVGQHFASP